MCPSEHPLSETMAQLFAGVERIRKEAEMARLSARRLTDEVAAKERELAVEMEKALTRLQGQGDAHWRKVKAEAEVSGVKYDLGLMKSKKRSAWAAWKDRLEQYETIKAIAHAYNRELRELGG